MEVSTTRENVETSISNFNPMETFPLSSVIDREYVLDNFSWLSTSPSGTVLRTYSLPGDIINSSSAGNYLKEKLNGFKYYRTKFRVGVRVVSNRTMYGRLMVSQTYLPNKDDTWRYPGSNATVTLSGYPHMLVSATSSETVYMDIPFVYPQRFADLGVLEPLVGIKITVMNPITSVEELDTGCSVIVTAQLVECELLYPVQPVSLQSNEGLLKSENGVISNALIGGRDTMAKLSSNFSVGSKLMHAYDAASHTAQALGLQKPTSQTLVEKFQKGVLNQNTYGRGLETNTVFASDPEKVVSSTVPITTTDNEMNLLKLVQTPTFVLYQSLNPLGANAATIWYDDIIGMNHNFAKYISKAFKYKSYSHKLKIYVSASIFHNVRLVFWITPTLPVGIPSTTEFTQYYHQIYDITGDTEFDFTLPYMLPGVMTNSATTNTGCVLNAGVLAWSVSNQLESPPIYLNVYHSAAPDFTVAGQVDVSYIYSEVPPPPGSQVELQSNPREDFTKEFSMFHPSFKYYYHDGFVQTDVTSVKELMLRKYPVQSRNVLEYFPLMLYPNSTNGECVGYEYFMVPYAFYRGGLRLTATSTNNGKMACLANIGGDKYLQGYVGMAGDAGQMDVEIPYYDDQWFRCISKDDPLDTQLFITGTTGKNVFTLTSVSDDFSLGFIRGIRDGLFVNNDAYSRFRDYFN